MAADFQQGPLPKPLGKGEGGVLLSFWLGARVRDERR